MTDVPWLDWYQSLSKPAWTPAPRTIGLIWQILYPVIIATFGFVFVQAGRGRLPLLVALPFAINLVANLIFTPIQFGMRNLPLAAVDELGGVKREAVLCEFRQRSSHRRSAASIRVASSALSLPTIFMTSDSWIVYSPRLTTEATFSPAPASRQG
jgi:tryptophan-rich sensory protein